MADSVTSPERDAYILSPDFLRKLEQVAIASRKIMVGRTKGERRSARRGTSVEFADFRGYLPGDDLRYLDWNAFARLQRLFLKLFIEEEDLHIYLLLDTSRSMDFGSPTKFQWCLRAAAALGYIALCTGDRVQLYAHARGRGKASRQFRGRGTAPEAFAWLAALRPDGETDLGQAVRWLQLSMPAPGVTFVLSDLLSPDWETAVSRLGVARGEACLVQVLSTDEISPSLRGDLRLIDSEDGRAREVTMGASVLRRYASERDRFVASVHEACNRWGFSHLLTVTDESVEDFILKTLRHLGVIK
jgi:uncharacterized protein (DUF58 family)